MIHTHITFADEKGNACGGHLAKGTIVFACEFIIQAFDGSELIREYDEKTTLRLWK
jgi:predicted DNA-binding protein with PD1-like motif